MIPTTQKKIAETLAEEGFCVLPFGGRSMVPMLKNQSDKVLIKPLTEPPERHAVILYPDPRRQNTYILHRILSVREEHYITRGDNCLGKERIPKQAVIGVLDGFYRNGEYVECTAGRNLRYALLSCLTFPFRWIRYAAAVCYHRFMKGIRHESK